MPPLMWSWRWSQIAKPMPAPNPRSDQHVAILRTQIPVSTLAQPRTNWEILTTGDDGSGVWNRTVDAAPAKSVAGAICKGQGLPPSSYEIENCIRSANSYEMISPSRVFSYPGSLCDKSLTARAVASLNLSATWASNASSLFENCP